MNNFYMRLLIAFASLLALISTPALAFEYSDYRPFSLHEASAQHPAPDGESTGYSALIFKYRVQVKLLELPHPISAPLKGVVENWGKVVRQPSFAAMYQEQIRVKEGDKTYTLPIQHSLVEFVEKEVRVGEELILYLMWVGNTKNELVFLVNEFQTIKNGKGAV